MQNSFNPDKKYFIKILLIQLTISMLVILAVAIITAIINIAHGDPQAPPIIWLVSKIAISLLWIISTPISFLWMKNLSYFVYDDRIRVHKGILTKTQQNIPFRAITDFALQRTLYDRFLGIGSINVQTAGQSHNPSGYEGKLAGLLEYEKLHMDLREKVKTLHPVAEAVTTSESIKVADSEMLAKILDELKLVNKNLQKK